MFEAKSRGFRSGHLNASYMEACRICLATDVKLYSLQYTQLGTCMESVAGFTNNCMGLPNYVCYQCAPILLKCGQLIAKSKTALEALLDIFYKNGRVTKSLLKEQSRSQMNLESSLSSYILVNYDYIQYHSDFEETEFYQTESVRDMKNETVKPEIKGIKTETVKAEEIKVESPLEEVSNKAEFDLTKEENVENSLIEITDKAELNNSIEEVHVENPPIQVSDDENLIALEPQMLKENLQKCSERISSNNQHLKRPNQPKRSKNKAKKRKLMENALIRVGKNRSKNTKSERVANNRSKNAESIPDGNSWSNNPEVDKWSELRDIERHFKIFRIPYIERHTIWRSTQQCIQTGSELLCDVCGMSFSNADLLQAHSDLHNTSTRGKLKCAVCLVCFATYDALKYHVETIHGNRFYCKTCPMAFNNLEDAKCHRDLCMGAIARGNRRVSWT